MNEAVKRADMPKGTSEVLDRRTVYHSNKNLLGLVKKGHRVLDVGCGSGAITTGIRELTGEDGFVLGIDSSAHLIESAQAKYSTIPNLEFRLADVYTYKPEQKFDVVTAARVIQWLATPQVALAKMVEMVADGGCLTILDYNHEKITWEPAIPASMQVVYRAFLQWRSEAGMDNGIADNLYNLFTTLALKNINVTDESETLTKGDSGFSEQLSIWITVAETRGKQLVTDGYITEDQRVQAISEYKHWMETEAQSMKLYLLAVTGYKM